RGDFSSFNNEHSFGYILAIGGAVCYGLFSVLGKKLHYEKFTSMLVYYVSSLILITPTVYFSSGFAIPAKMSTFLAILFMGGLASSLGFVFWFKALQAGHTHKIANAIYVTPFLALAWVSLLNNEVVPVISIFGLVLIAGGILIQTKNEPS
ncbi:MAG: DMT family transporter, partial [Candidatus Micrarchaeota archaeon]